MSNIGRQNPPSSGEQPMSSKDPNRSTNSVNSGDITDHVQVANQTDPKGSTGKSVTDPGGSTELDMMYAGQGSVALVTGKTKRDVLLHEAQVHLQKFH